MRLLEWMLQPIVSLLVRTVVVEAEVQTAIRCADALQHAYARADQLEADGYKHLAEELRQQADGVDITRPGLSAIEYTKQFNAWEPVGGTESTTNGKRSMPAPRNTDLMKPEGPPQKRKRGRPRKHPTP